MVYRVTVKNSVVEWTPLTPDRLEGRERLAFSSREEAEAVVEELNDVLPSSTMGELTLQRPHPNDASDTDAYLVFQPQGRWVVE